MEISRWLYLCGRIEQPRDHLRTQQRAHMIRQRTSSRQTARRAACPSAQAALGGRPVGRVRAAPAGGERIELRRYRRDYMVGITEMHSKIRRDALCLLRAVVDAIDRRLYAPIAHANVAISGGSGVRARARQRAEGAELVRVME